MQSQNQKRKRSTPQVVPYWKLVVQQIRAKCLSLRLDYDYSAGPLFTLLDELEDKNEQ